MILSSWRASLRTGLFLTAALLLVLRLIDVLPGGRRHRLNIYRTFPGRLSQNTSTECIKTRTDPSFFVCPYNETRDKYISGALLSGGVWEPTTTRLFQRALARFPAATVLDLGANIGYYSLLAAAAGHRVVAVEPVLDNVIKLATAVHMNQLNESVLVLQNAVSVSRGTVEMSTSRDNQGGLRLVGRHRAADPDRLVTAVTLDDLIDQIHARHVIVKIDIEGHECKALDNTRRLFAGFVVPYIFMEWQRLVALQNLASSACPPRAVRRLAETLAGAGFLAHDMKFGIQLDTATANRWRADDIYWRHVSAPMLDAVAPHILPK